MKNFLRRTAAIALAVALSLPSVTLAEARQRDTGRERDKTELVLKVIQKVKKIFGIGTTEDGLTPPKP